jgi:hypothetical protein
MYYHLTPLHTHIDYGFGATADSFKYAADDLESLLKEKGIVLNEHLPINYLRRHAVELFLKSTIVIIHRRLSIPYGNVDPNGEPQVLVSGDWTPFNRLHSVKQLWIYVKFLFCEYKNFFDSFERVDWTFPVEIDDWIETIEKKDPRSTFFRYPNLRDIESDVDKANMTEGTPIEIMERLRCENTKQFILLLENNDGDIAGGYYYGGNTLEEFNMILNKCTNRFHGLHAALRIEVCGGG